MTQAKKKKTAVVATDESGAPEMHLAILQAEFDQLMQEHHLHHQIRENLSIQALIAFLAVIGVIAGQFTIFNDNIGTLRLLMLLPFLFIFLSYWFVRTNYSNLVIEKYIVCHLRPEMQKLAGSTETLSWFQFLYTEDKTFAGTLIRAIQLFARLALILTPAITSMVLFTNGIRGLENYTPLDFGLLFLQINGIAVTFWMVLAAGYLTEEIHKIVMGLPALQSPVQQPPKRLSIGAKIRRLISSRFTRKK